MTDCVSRDRLVDLLAAMDRPAVPILDHLASCMECRAEVASLERVRELIGGEEPLPAGFVDRVMHSIEASRVSHPAVNAADPPSSTREARQGRSPISSLRPAAGTALVALLSGVAACVVLMAAGASAAPGAAFTPLSLFMGLLAGAGLTAHQLAGPRNRTSNRPVLRSSE